MVSFRLLSQEGTYPRAGVVIMSLKRKVSAERTDRDRSGLRIRPIGSSSNARQIYS